MEHNKNYVKRGRKLFLDFPHLPLRGVLSREREK